MTTSDNKPFEIRDPVLGFISLDETEQQVIDSRAMQRLKHIHQLAMTYQVYPGATHKRFEHSLGVMELAGRAFDVLMATASAKVRAHMPIRDAITASYWRKVVRLAALCHDLGHLPFSHATESLLPPGWNHERMSYELMLDGELREIWETAKPPIDPTDIAKVALGPSEYLHAVGDSDRGHLTDWETLLSHIVTNDTFGVDRMDYLLRDSHHLGVAYGRFDHERLIRMLRVVGSRDEASPLGVGIDIGGIHAAESLLNARYFMFMQVYYHKTRVAYDLHLEDFLREWQPEHGFAPDTSGHQRLDDNVVLSAIATASREPDNPGHVHARRLTMREHFKLLSSIRDHEDSDLGARFDDLERRCVTQLGEENVRSATRTLKVPPPSTLIRMRDGRLEPMRSLSEMLPTRADSNLRFLFVHPSCVQEATASLSTQ